MSGWTTKERKAGAGCYGCHQERGAVVQAFSARINRVGILWLCAGCAQSGTQRQSFIDEYARRLGLPTGEERAIGTRERLASPPSGCCRRRNDAV